MFAAIHFDFIALTARGIEELLVEFKLRIGFKRSLWSCQWSRSIYGRSLRRIVQQTFHRTIRILSFIRAFSLII